MKLRFNSFDIVCGVTELQSLVGLRVNQIYDVDNKTFLIRLQGGTEGKKTLLIESGIRFHTTTFQWPKNMIPSGFCMKLRKHLKNKRLESLTQLGVDRIVDFVFGSGEAAYHIIIELYDRGNIILTDHETKILYILRHHQGNSRVALQEKYSCEHAKIHAPLPNETDLLKAIFEANHGDTLRSLLMPMVPCGPTVVDHVLIKYKLDNCIITKVDLKNKDMQINVSQNRDKKIKKKQEYQQLLCREFNQENDIKALMFAIQDISEIMENAKRTVSRGFIIQKIAEIPLNEARKEIEYFHQNIEYHPYNFCQYQEKPMLQYETFMIAVDEFYSKLEGQKLDMKTLQQEREVLKKLSNVKKDHAKRIENLNKLQESDKRKAELITINQSLVNSAILTIQSAIAKQMSWPEIDELVKSAQSNGDPIARIIKQLKLEINHISLKLSDPYNLDTENVNKKENEDNTRISVIVDVDLALSAWANARKYYDQKRSAAQKEQKTMQASEKALKSAEKKTQQALKDVETLSKISKARKIYWFEKFYWFISSENYLVIGGRDAQQNELIVKRYMGPNDIYVHAEIQGASSVVIRNPTDCDVPPKTLLEAGTMAISYSVAWDAKIVTNAYWVRSNQVSKSAPTGEYLGTGSFMIRGKKNFLPSCNLIMGLSLLFKLEDSFIEKHRGERKVRTFQEEQKPQGEIIIREMEVTLREDKEDNKEAKSVKSENEILAEFPDIQVKVKQDKNKLSFNGSLKESGAPEIDHIKLDSLEQEEITITTAVLPRKKKQQNAKKRKEEKEYKSRKIQNQLLQRHQSMDGSQNKSVNQPVKRGQKSKLKKIKAKYKDQDEEERQMRMQILKSPGKIHEITAEPNVGLDFMKDQEPKPLYEQKQTHRENLEDTGHVFIGADVEMIDSLTGQPFDQDEILFLIPVVAPYQALQNYKYKAKLIPGTGKRGRVARTALAIFSKEKTSTAREKDLLKSVCVDILARNIPGKVKLSIPQLSK